MNYTDDKIFGEVYSVNFSDFVPSENNIEPNYRITHFMTLGPFVAQTDGGFETEYFYHRDKVLDVDYLESSGGERSIVPYIGQKVKNDFYGLDYLRWIKGLIKWDALRFDGDEASDCDDAMFATEQKNCVCYAAVYIDCDNDEKAVLCYNTSGCSVFLNGENVDYLPYGRVKGVKSYGRLTPVSLKKGRNLVLFKLRTGYICDAFDLSIDNFMLIPVLCESDGVGVACPIRSGAYFGTKDNPRQIFTTFAGCFDDSEKSALSYKASSFEETLEISAMKKGEVAILRPSFPATGTLDKINFTLNCKDFDFTVITDPYCGFDGKEYCFSDFHFDTTYHQDQKTYAIGALHITNQMMKKMRTDPNFKAVLSEVDYLHPYYSAFPEDRELLRNAFKEGRAEADCFYNQPNDLTSSGEGFVRNMVYGQLYHRDVLGRISTVYNPCDVFGHFNQMSQVISKGGVKSARWSKLVWGLDRLIRHMSPDGTTLIHDKGLDKQTALRLGLDCCAESSGSNNKLPSYSQDGDTSWREKTISKATDAVMSELADAVIESDKKNIAETGHSKIGLTSRDLTQHHSGVLLTRTDFKQANRLGENLLITAEKFSSIAALLGAQYPDLALDKAWRQLLCGQHHDSITGTNNEISFVDLMIQYREVAELASGIVDGAIGYICSQIDSKDFTYAVFNPHPFERTDACEISVPNAENKAMISSGGEIYPLTVVSASDGICECIFTPKIPSLGYDCFKLTDYKQSKICDTSSFIENEYYRITVDSSVGGGIVSIFDKINNKEIVQKGTDGPANRLVILKEDTHRCETQHEFYTTGHKMYSSDYVADVKTEKNDVFQQITCSYKMDTVANICQVITLYKGVDRIDLKTYVDDYIDRDDLFTVTFPLDIKGGKTVFDDRFAPHVSGKSKNKLQYQTHQFFSYSHSRIVPANQWIDLGPSVTVNLCGGSLNIGMTSIIRKDIDKDLVSAGDKLLTSLSKKAIPVTPFTDETRQLGESTIHFNEDLLNCDTRFVLTLKGDGNTYAEKLLSSASNEVRNKFNSSSLSVLYAKDSDNLFNKEIDVFLIQADKIETLDSFVNDITNQLENGRFINLQNVLTDISVDKTDDYGVSLINNGNISCSVDGDNLMTVMLFHTADFYGNVGKTTGTAKGLIPENKSHCFTYSLCPHTGSYREGDIYKKAFSFNDPFIASELNNNNNGKLPTEHSFMSCDGKFAITSVRLGGYPLASMKNNFGTINDRGLVVRGFETDGKENTFTLNLPFTAVKAETLNLLDQVQTEYNIEKADTFTASATPHSIETLRFLPKDDIVDNKTVFGAISEPVQPVYVRSWEHNLGSMPMGYLSLAGTISRNVKQIDALAYELTVTIANNKIDSKACGVAKLTGPAGFTSERTQFPYQLDANEHVSYSFKVSKINESNKGIFRLVYEDNGQKFEDILEFGFFNPDVYLSINGNEIVAEVTNFSGETLSGTIAIASPFETWEYGKHNRNLICGITPSVYPVKVENGKTERFVFKVNAKLSPVSDTFWAVAKLMVNGRIYFSHDSNSSVHHCCWTHHFYDDEIVSDGKSLRKLLEMN